MGHLGEGVLQIAIFINFLCAIYTFFITTGVVFFVGSGMATTYKRQGSTSTWTGRAAVFGLFGGLLAPVVGSVVTVISWFSDPAWHGLSLHIAGTSLFVITFPLLLLGAHCLDLLDKQKPSTHTDPQEGV